MSPEFQQGASGPEQTPLTAEEVQDCRTVISKLWDKLNGKQQRRVWDELTDGETIQLVDSLPEPPREELDAMSNKVRELIQGRRALARFQELGPDETLRVIQESPQYTDLRQRHLDERPEFIKRLKEIPPLFPEKELI